MLNLNGKLVPLNDKILTPNNRAFKYGDSVFETVKVLNNRVVFWEDHYFRLMASLRMLRMKIPMSFTPEFLESEILKTVKENNFSTTSLRVRLSVYRNDGGLYLPTDNNVSYLIEVSENTYHTKTIYEVDLFKDYYVYSGLLSTIKTNNNIVNTLASIYANENDLDNSILLNDKKSVVEFTNGNIFLVFGNTIKTPRIEDGSLKGIIRKKIIELLNRKEDYTLEECSITPFELLKADEMFLTNSIIGIQPVTKYRKKQFSSYFTTKLKKELEILEITSH